MEIREATEQDIPAIVGLLKLSLGESLMPKSEHYWQWKHLDNPFGRSPVLVCLENGELIGVRAFMRWEWICSGTVYRAVRAVDTATHPKHQGKGIFKKLTLSLVEKCVNEGSDFVFNTPNLQSKPGYLKMGWIEAGRLPISFRIDRPFSMLKNLVAKPSFDAGSEVTGELNHYLRHPGIEALISADRLKTNAMVSNVSVRYLQWRYCTVPVASYVAIGDEINGELNGLIIGRIKETRLGREFRITDFFQHPERNINGLSRKMKDFKRKWSIDYTTITGIPSCNGSKNIHSRWLKGELGPVVTVRALRTTNLGKLISFSNWSPSLGDLELF